MIQCEIDGCLDACNNCLNDSDKEVCHLFRLPKVWDCMDDSVVEEFRNNGLLDEFVAIGNNEV